MSDDNFFASLSQRKIFRTAAIYVAAAWGATEVIVTVVEQLFLPAWVSTLTVIVFVVGFPVAMFLAWTFDITKDGIQRTTVTSGRGAASIAGSMALLVAGTAGLFLLIRPGMQQAESGTALWAAEHSVAVLPFENVSRLADDLYLSEGLSDELRDQLGGVQGLQIAARSSSIAIRNQAVGAVKAAGTLGVRYLVEGSLRRRGNRLSISVQVIDGQNGLAVWTNNYERGPLELLQVQQDIARQVIGVVYPDVVDPVPAAPATLDASAHDLMLLARHHENQVRDKPIVDVELQLKAVDLYRQAVAIDPDSALAHSRLASALMYVGDFAGAEAPIAQAVELNPDLSDVQTALGKYTFYTLGVVAAQAALKRGVELGPNNVDALSSYGWVSWSLEGPSAAEKLYRRAAQLDPLSLSRYADLGTFLGMNGRRDDTLEIVSAIESTFSNPQSFRVIARLLELTGDVDEAIVWAIRAHNAVPENPESIGLLAELYAVIGEFETALEVNDGPDVGLLFHMRRYDDIIEEGGLMLIDQPNDITLRYLIAFAFNATGKHEEALRMLQSTGLSGDIKQIRGAPDMEATVYLMDAIAGTGEIDLARQIAERSFDITWHSSPDWWADVYNACALAVLERDDEAFARLAIVKTSPRIPWEPMLRDAPCFRRYATSAQFSDLLAWIDERKATLRAKLPQTLAAAGVSLN